MFCFQDGLPTVLVETQQPVDSTTSPHVCSVPATSQQPSTVTETGLLHRLLTGQVDEADVHRAAEVEAEALLASRTALETSADTTEQQRPGECTSGETSSSLMLEGLAISDCSDDILGQIYSHQEVPHSVDDLTVSSCMGSFNYCTDLDPDRPGIVRSSSN